MADRMIPSTRPGFTWAVNCYKHHEKKGVCIVSAIEGEHDGGWFRTKHPGSRTVRDVLAVPRLTAKRKQALIDDLVDRMADANLIEKEA